MGKQQQPSQKNIQPSMKIHVNVPKMSILVLSLQNLIGIVNAPN
jgi:hypothetical protein